MNSFELLRSRDAGSQKRSAVGQPLIDLRHEFGAPGYGTCDSERLVAELPPAPGPPTPEAAAHLAELGSRYGIELVGPPLH